MKHILILLLLVMTACANPESWTSPVDNQWDPAGDHGDGGGGSSGGGGETPGGPVGDFKLSCEEARFVRLLNLYRQSNGRSILVVSKAGVLSSRWHAQDMIDKNYFSHTEPNGRSFSSRAGEFGYGAWSENIAAGNTSADGTFCQWKNSPGHNSNMLGSHSSLGIGNAHGGGYGSYWSNNFGGGVSDALAEPLTNEAGCTMPTAVPGC